MTRKEFDEIFSKFKPETYKIADIPDKLNTALQSYINLLDEQYNEEQINELHNTLLTTYKDYILNSSYFPLTNIKIKDGDQYYKIFIIDTKGYHYTAPKLINIATHELDFLYKHYKYVTDDLDLPFFRIKEEHIIYITLHRKFPELNIEVFEDKIIIDNNEYPIDVFNTAQFIEASKKLEKNKLQLTEEYNKEVLKLEEEFNSDLNKFKLNYIENLIRKITRNECEDNKLKNEKWNKIAKEI